MRLWSLHPKYLDAKGLVALWREALLAQNVLLGNTKGYRNHPQLDRFKACRNPVGAIASFLRAVEKEARARNYHFDSTKINGKRLNKPLPVTSGQLQFECGHLGKKLKVRDREKLKFLYAEKVIELHPLFREIPGAIETWEIV